MKGYYKHKINSELIVLAVVQYTELSWNSGAVLRLWHRQYQQVYKANVVLSRNSNRLHCLLV